MVNEFLVISFKTSSFDVIKTVKNNIGGPESKFIIKTDFPRNWI